MLCHTGRHLLTNSLIFSMDTPGNERKRKLYVWCRGMRFVGCVFTSLEYLALVPNPLHAPTLLLPLTHRAREGVTHTLRILVNSYMYHSSKSIFVSSMGRSYRHRISSKENVLSLFSSQFNTFPSTLYSWRDGCFF